MAYDILNALDINRNQQLPLVIRDLLSFLFYPFSLTKRSRQKHSKFSVECLHFQMDEKLLRDVKILADNKIQMLARTECSKETYEKIAHEFVFSGIKPIGDFLFNSKKMFRTQIEVQILAGLELNWFAQYEQRKRIYWYRCSVWMYDNQAPLYLMEVFY